MDLMDSTPILQKLEVSLIQTGIDTFLILKYQSLSTLRQEKVKRNIRLSVVDRTPSLLSIV